MSNEKAADDVFPRATDDRSDVAKALHRVADALFRQAKAAERAVLLQEQMIANQTQLARSSAVLEQALRERV